MLEQLRRFNADVATMEEMLSLSAFARMLHAEYETRNVEVPEWLDEKRRTLDRAIREQSRDALEMRLREIKAQESQLLTKEERKQSLASERERIEKALAVSTT